MRYTVKDPQTGELQVVGNLDGYDGWPVMLEEADKAIGELAEDETFDETSRTWTVDQTLRAERLLRAESLDTLKMLKAIKSLRTRVTTLENEAPILKSRIKTLEDEVAALKAA